jgi:hypothetical protein
MCDGLLRASRVTAVSNAACQTHPSPPTKPGLVKLAHQMLTFHRWGDEHRYVLRFLVIFLLMIVELLFENCMVW